MDAEGARRILAHVRERRREFVELLARLVESESPTGDPEAQTEVLAILAGALSASGFSVRRLRGGASGGHLLALPADRARGRPYQLVLGHTDTVWPRGTLRTMPLRVKDDVVSGPGTFDMKAGLAQLVLALRALRELDLRPSVTPVAFVNSDEESGSHDSTRHVVRLAAGAERAFVLEPALGLDAKLKTGRRGVGQFVVTARGRSAHAGLDPEAGASAVLEIARVVERLHALSDAGRRVTVTVGLVEGGIAPNVVPPEARAVVDVRVPSAEEAVRVERAIRALEPATPGTSLEVEGLFRRAPMVRTPRGLWEAARQAGTLLGVALEEGTSGGASDGSTSSLYTPTLDGLGAVGDGAHAPHEHVRVDATLERTALLALLLLLPSAGPDGYR